MFIFSLFMVNFSLIVVNGIRLIVKSRGKETPREWQKDEQRRKLIEKVAKIERFVKGLRIRGLQRVGRRGLKFGNAYLTDKACLSDR